MHGVYDTEPLIDDGPVEWYRILHAVHWRRRHLGPVNSVIFALAAVRRTVLERAGSWTSACATRRTWSTAAGWRPAAASC